MAVKSTMNPRTCSPLIVEMAFAALKSIGQKSRMRKWNYEKKKRYYQTVYVVNSADNESFQGHHINFRSTIYVASAEHFLMVEMRTWESGMLGWTEVESQVWIIYL